MHNEVFTYPVLIKETYLDTFGHMNNATYLTLFEEARWDLVTKRGFGLKEIQALGIGPTVLEINIKYLKEIYLRDQILIKTRLISYEGKVGKLLQAMWRGDVVCCQAEFIFGLFSLKERKLMMPTPEWLKAIGFNP
jgi:acyl-CoA thioester hydrolase